MEMGFGAVPGGTVGTGVSPPPRYRRYSEHPIRQERYVIAAGARVGCAISRALSVLITLDATLDD